MATVAYLKYKVQIDGVGTGTGGVDTFKWSDNGGTSWDDTTVDITGEEQDLNNGVKIKFDMTTGHTNSDYWYFWAGDGIFLGERLMYYYQDYSANNLVMHNLHLGTDTQTVDSQLQYEIPQWTDCLKNTAYSYFRLTYDANAYKQIPDYMIVAKGRKLYDPRDGSTAFSQNPALVWYDFLTNKRYGLGVPSANVDSDSVSDVATWCDDNDYEFNGILLDRVEFGDHLAQIMANFKAFSIWSEGKYYLKTFTDDAAVMNLDENDVEISPESFHISIPGIMETPDCVKITFSDAEKNYTANYAKWPDTADETYFGDPTTFEVTLIGTTSITQARKIAKYIYLRNRFNKEFAILGHPRCFSLEPGDMVTITHEFPGWVNEKLRVKTVGYPQEGMVPLTLMEEDSSIYVDP